MTSSTPQRCQRFGFVVAFAVLLAPSNAGAQSVARPAYSSGLMWSTDSRALGWDTPSPNGTAGHLLAPISVGHTGFTGPSIWIDPTRDLVIVVLGNRVHPTRANAKWGELSVRGNVADRVVTGLEIPR